VVQGFSHLAHRLEADLRQKEKEWQQTLSSNSSGKSSFAHSRAVEKKLAEIEEAKRELHQHKRPRRLDDEDEKEESSSEGEEEDDDEDEEVEEEKDEEKAKDEQKKEPPSAVNRARTPPGSRSRARVAVSAKKKKKSSSDGDVSGTRTSACRACREAKKGCDSGRPCARCRASGKTCS
jgi:hypothetical protein